MIIDEKKILDQITKTRKTYRVIAEENGTTIEEIYRFIEDYCRKNNVQIKVGMRGREFVSLTEDKKDVVKESNKKDLEKILKIREWCRKNNRLPRALTKTAPKKNQDTVLETDDQLESRYSMQFFRIKRKLELIEDLNKPEFEIERQTYKIITEIEEQYNISSIHMFWKKAIELRDWCEENQRKPKKPKGIKLATKKEIKDKKETFEQKELRMYYAYISLNKHYKHEDECKSSKKREILDILKSIEEKYDKEIKDEESKRKVTKKQLAKAILTTIAEGKVTLNEIKKIALKHGVNLEEILQTLDNVKEER